MKVKENEILEKAIEVFQEITDLNASILVAEERVVDNTIDAVVDIGGRTCYVEVKLNLNTALVALLVNYEKRINQPLVVVTRYVTPNMAIVLRQNDVQFIDTAGNAYINLGNIYVYIIGQKEKQLLIEHKKNRLFKPTGLKVIFALLNNPGLENHTYRKVAEIAQVALGTVNWIMRDLRIRNYLIDIDKTGRRIIHKRELLERWVTTYPDNLRKGLLLGKYKAGNENWIENVKMKKREVFWGGERAAGIITKYLRPQNTILYIDENYLHKFVKDNRLINTQNGNIEILKKFWLYKTEKDNNNIVPPILIYADLLSTGEPRNRETAQALYEKEIYRYIR